MLGELDPSANVPEGLYCVEDHIVTLEHIAKHLANEVQVLSTPSMIYFMEKTAMNCVQRHLPQGYTTVGTMVNVKHLAPAPVNSTIKVEVKLVSKNARRLMFEVRAYWGNVIIGEGLHERFIVNTKRFIEKLRSQVK